VRLPDSAGNVSQRPLLFLVEGRYDISFLTLLSRQLHRSGSDIPDLEALQSAGKLLFIPTGGNPQLWTDRLGLLACPEIHLYDRESAAEAAQRTLAATRVNARANCRAFVTSKRSLENYLHPRAIEAAGGGSFTYGDLDDLGAVVACDWYMRTPQAPAWNEITPRARSRFIQRAKKWLNTIAVEAMTIELLREQDPQGDLLLILDAVRVFCSPSR
jgi:putative ATP-dependent endonuclease of OLD family